MARQLDIKGMTPKAFSNGHETAFALVNKWVDQTDSHKENALNALQTVLNAARS